MGKKYKIDIPVEYYLEIGNICSDSVSHHDGARTEMKVETNLIFPCTREDK